MAHTINEKTFDELSNLLKEGEKIGLSFTDLLTKIANIKETIKQGKIKIVLLSSFSDGKTSTIAGLIENIEDNMKIDIDESSDEIVVYHPHGLAEQFEIVDTPGLFGRKEKEIDGHIVKFSEITEKYLSEAHVIIYVCDAVTPLKDSHAKLIEKIMRTYHKLSSTIFLINKMDEAGYDVLDEQDFKRGVQIKKENLIQRLKDTIHLTQEEENHIHIVCIAADPKGKGIKYWLNKIENYRERSHIDDLRQCINEVVKHSDAALLQDNSNKSSIVDIISVATQSIQNICDSVSLKKGEIAERNKDIETDLTLLRKDLTANKGRMERLLNSLKDEVISNINAASMENISDVVEQSLGTNGKEISFYVFDRKINQIIQECSEGNNAAIRTSVNNIENNMSIIGDLIQNGLTKSVGIIKNFHISGEQVKAIRNVIFKSYKFKPWGAIKLAGKITKAMPYIGGAIEISIDIFAAVKEKKKIKKLQELKNQLKSAINEKIKNVFDTFDNEEEYYKNFAPSYIEMINTLKEREKDFQQIENQTQKLDSFNQKLKQWYEHQAIDVEYEEV